MKAKCDKCKKEFTVSMLTKKIESDVLLIYVKCYHCKAEYPAYYENNEIRSNQREIDSLRKQQGKSKTKKVHEDFESQIKVLVSKRKELIEELKAKYIGEENKNEENENVL